MIDRTEQVVSAAERAIAINNEIRRIDDEGKHSEIGMWHLLDTLMDYSEFEGVDFMEVLQDLAMERKISGSTIASSEAGDHEAGADDKRIDTPSPAMR